MKILLSAYACHPERGSEPGLGWNWLRELARTNEVWVLFYAGSGQEEAVKRVSAKLPYAENIHLYPIDVPAALRNRAFRLRYEWWQWRAYQAAQKLAGSVAFSLIHHITISAWWNCGHLWRLPIPFVFGPIAGAQQTPKQAYPFLRFQDRLAEFSRSLTFYASWFLWLRPRRAMKRAALVIAGNERMEAMVRKRRPNSPTALMCQIGMDPEAGASGQPARPGTKPLRLIFSGLMFPRKNFGFLLQALQLLPHEVDWHLRVLGDGPLLQHWVRMVEGCGLKGKIEFHGRVDFAKMREHYTWANAFVFPSCRDSNATVLLEAATHALPTVALRIDGNTAVLNEKNALLVDITTPQQMVQDYANAIARLYFDPELRNALGAGAQKFGAEQLTWPSQHQRMQALYRTVVAASAPTAEPGALAGYSDQVRI